MILDSQLHSMTLEGTVLILKSPPDARSWSEAEPQGTNLVIDSCLLTGISPYIPVATADGNKYCHYTLGFLVLGSPHRSK